jgi:hypothetical protein
MRTTGEVPEDQQGTEGGQREGQQVIEVACGEWINQGTKQLQAEEMQIVAQREVVQFHPIGHAERVIAQEPTLFGHPFRAGRAQQAVAVVMKRDGQIDARKLKRPDHEQHTQGGRESVSGYGKADSFHSHLLS